MSKYLTLILLKMYLLFFLIFSYAYQARAFCHSDPNLGKIPWDMSKLAIAPEYQWIDANGPVRSLFYKGPDFHGHPTRVFAYYATPDTLSGQIHSNVSYPGIVLAHGGGGTAFKEWVLLWAQRGYAAIAPDLIGGMPGRLRIPDGGPDNDSNIWVVNMATTDQWPYHAVANLVLTHTLLRNFKDVDAEKTAITGISWGGFLTCIVSGIDTRFKAAVPVYGCGFIYENSAWQPRFQTLPPDEREKWIKLWDPSQYLGSAEMPVFFINGTNDFSYWLKSYAKTYSLVKGRRNLRITPGMIHDHPHGWEPNEILIFVDSYLRNTIPLPLVSHIRQEGTNIVAEVQSKTKIRNAALYYTTNSVIDPNSDWQDRPAIILSSLINVSLPPEAKACFITVYDECEAMVSSELLFINPPSSQ